MVHRPFRLKEIMQVLTKYKLEPKRMQLVYPYIDREPNMVLIEALKGGNSRITVERPLIVYEKPGLPHPQEYKGSHVGRLPLAYADWSVHAARSYRADCR